MTAIEFINKAAIVSDHVITVVCAACVIWALIEFIKIAGFEVWKMIKRRFS